MKKMTSCEPDRRRTDHLRDQSREITRLKYKVELLYKNRGKKTQSTKTFLSRLFSNKLLGVEIIIKKLIILQRWERWDIFQHQGLFVLFLPVIYFCP